MLCKNCGQQMDSDAKFCPVCGAPVETNSDGANSFNETKTSGSSEESQKINLQDLITLENIERFAPLAVFLPVVMTVVVAFFGGIPLLGFLLKAAFILLSLGSAGALGYITLKYKNKNDITSWIPAFAALMAAVACMFIAGGSKAHMFFGFIAFVIGLETTARIVIEGNPLDSPVNPAGALETYRRLFNNYRQESRAAREAEMNAANSPNNVQSVFDGSGLELLGLAILCSLVTMITFGIAGPWMICRLYRWRINHTVIDGRRLVFTGTGAGLFGNYIKWILLTIITLGIYGLFVYVALRKWELQHTFVEGDSVPVGSVVSDYDGSTWGYIGYSILCSIIVIFTLGIGSAWAVVLMQRWDTSHQIISRGRLNFDGTALGFFGECILIVILSLITCGIYSPWAVTRLNRYVIRHTHFDI